MADNSSSQNGSSFLKSLLGVVATIAVFAILIVLAYGLRDSYGPIAPTVANPPPTAAALKAKDTEVLTSYGWVNQEAGIVRLPVDRATDLVIQELNH